MLNTASGCVCEIKYAMEPRTSKLLELHVSCLTED